jgi:hypothetical protein
MTSRTTIRKITFDFIPHLSESSGRIGPVKLRVSRKPTVSGHGGDCRVLVERRIPDPAGIPPHTLATAISESLNRPSPVLKYQRSSYLRAGTERNVKKRTKSMLASKSALADQVVTLVMRLVSRCILRSEYYLADPLFNPATQMGRPSEEKKLLTAKIAKISRRSQSRDLSPAAIEGKY